MRRTLRAGQKPRGADPDAAIARRVGWRLAALTVGLIAALLLVLGVAVYATVQSVLLHSLQDTVRQRRQVFLRFHSGRQGGPPGPPQFQGPGPYIIGDVRFTVANQR